MVSRPVAQNYTALQQIHKNSKAAYRFQTLTPGFKKLGL